MPTRSSSVTSSAVALLLPLAFPLAGACATANDGQRTQTLVQERLDVVRAYEVERADLEARQEREHSRMEQRHELEQAALDEELIAALNESGRDLREVQARLAAARRIFSVDAAARLQRIDARVEQIVEQSSVTTELIQALAELGAQRAAIQQGLDALDLVGDDAWFQARRAVWKEIGSLDRDVDALDRADL